MRMRRAAGLALALALMVSVAACGAPDDEVARPTVTTTLPPETPHHLPELPVGAGNVGPDDRVRAHESTLRVNGRIVDLTPMRVDAFVVVKGGVYFRNGSELWFTDLTRARTTGFTDVQSLIASSDGSRIAFLDRDHGPKDRFGTPLAISIAYDATTGKPLVASYVGMGDITKDDLFDLYTRAPPAVLRFDGNDLVVRGAVGGDHRVPLDE
jgi:hypothetical protein